jgi:hypothetical protein
MEEVADELTEKEKELTRATEEVIELEKRLQEQLKAKEH